MTDTTTSGDASGDAIDLMVHITVNSGIILIGVCILLSIPLLTFICNLCRESRIKMKTCGSY